MKKKIKCVSISKDTFENLQEDFHQNLKYLNYNLIFQLCHYF